MVFGPLAICKPAIRSTAQEDNVILGFSGNDLYKNNSLIYIARVTLPLDGRKYSGQVCIKAGLHLRMGWSSF